VIARLQDQPAATPISTHAEIQLIRKDSTSHWVEIHVKSFEYQGKPALQIITLDIAERKQMEAARVETETLQRALDQQLKLKELKGSFISMVSHLFRTPLSVISTTGYLLENYNDKLPQEKRQEYFGKIRSQIDRLDELIENVLTISQNEAKMMAFAPSPIDLEACCRDIVAEMQITSPTLHQISFTADGDFSAAMVDDKLLRNILMNLLSNAIKYSPDGGEVQVKLTRHGDEAIFEISDSGIGILAEDQKHLFEPFHRGQNIAGIKGSGLGLKIAKDFVDGHGGTISCVSEVGKGTTFTVRLPIVQGEMQAETKNSSSTS
jgi:signal transduction histidine kinase